MTGYFIFGSRVMSYIATSTQIKSTITNFFTYSVLLPFPFDVGKQIEKIQRDFLLGGVDGESNPNTIYVIVLWYVLPF